MSCSPHFRSRDGTHIRLKHPLHALGTWPCLVIGSSPPAVYITHLTLKAQGACFQQCDRRLRTKRKARPAVALIRDRVCTVPKHPADLGRTSIQS